MDHFPAKATDFSLFHIIPIAPWRPTSGCFHRGVTPTAPPT